MGGSLIVAGYFTFVHDALAAQPVALVPELAAYAKLVWGSLITTAIWVGATFLTPAESDATLSEFVAKVNPGGPGWKRWENKSGSTPWSVPRGIASMLAGSIGVYAALIATGSWLYGETVHAAMLGGLAAICTAIIFKLNRG